MKMSNRSYIPPTESPPSLDTTDERADGADTPESSHSFPTTPNEYFEDALERRHIPENEKEEKTEPSPPLINDDNRDKLLSNNIDISNSKIDSGNETYRNNIDNDNIKHSNSDSCYDKRINITISNDTSEKSLNLYKTTKSDSSCKLVSTLTLTDDHPLMGPSSPDSPSGQVPDLLRPHCIVREDHSALMSPSSTEDESLNRSPANGDLSSLHSEGFPNEGEPQRNTSKNNLYFSENFVMSESPKSVEGCLNRPDSSLDSLSHDKKVSINRPDVIKTDGDRAFVEKLSNGDPEKKKIMPDVKAPKVSSTDTSERKLDFANKSVILSSPKTPKKRDKVNNDNRFILIGSSPSFYVSEVSDFPDSPSQLRKVLNYEPPVEHPSVLFDDVSSPDSSTASKPEQERSLYQAEVDPIEGCVTLKPRTLPLATSSARKRIKPLLTETDTDSAAVSNTLFVSCQNELSGSASSLDSLSDCSMHSDGVIDVQNIKSLENEENTKKGSHILMKKADSLNDGSETETETEGGLIGKPIENNKASTIAEKIIEYSLAEERRDARLWLKVTLPTGEQRTIDMKVIEPYKRVLSHGGYALSGNRDAIVVFSACYLPDSSRVDYNYVMDNLFLYVLTTLEQLVTDDYILIYLHGSASKRSMPTFHWLKKCYQLVDRRLRKSLKHLYLVHPTFWLKSIMWMTRPFISSKFSRKLSYVYNLDELENLVPVEQAAIPEKVRRYDSRRT